MSPRPIPFYPFPAGDHRVPSFPALPDRLTEAEQIQIEPQIAEIGSEDVDLRHANIARALEFGIAVGQLAIRDVLLNGRLGILGPKPTEARRHRE